MMKAMSLRFDMAKLITNDKSISMAEDGLVKVDGISAFRRIDRDGETYIQFCDHDRMRSKCRGTRFVEVPLTVLMNAIFDASEEKGKADEQQ
jgi:hypothetical protein